MLSCTAITTMGTTVLVACGPGLLHMFKRVEEKKTGDNAISKKSYQRVKEIRVHEGEASGCGITLNSHILSELALSPSGETVVGCSNSHQLFNYFIGGSDFNAKGLVPKQESGIINDQQPEIANFSYVIHPFHFGEILGMDVCVRKPLIVTCSADRTIRVWNFENNNVEAHKEFAEEAYSISLHPSGLYICVGFSDKLRLMNLLIDDIRCFKEFPIRGCRECAFSSGGHMFAAVHGNTIQLYSSTTFDLITNLKGHNGKIKCLIWSIDDSKLVSCGIDGAIYEWQPTTGKRLNENVLKSCGYTYTAISSDCHTIYAVGSDNKIKEISESAIVKELESRDNLMTTVCMSDSGRMLFAGTAKGSIRSFKVPLTQAGDWTDYSGHCGRISKMRITGQDEYLITVSDDCAVLVWKIQDKEGRTNKVDKDFTYADEILITRSDLEEKNSHMFELKTRIDELKMENEYQLRLKEMNHNDRLKELTEKFIQEMETLKTKNQVLRTEKEREDIKHEEQLLEVIEKHNAELQEIEANANQKLMSEYEKLQEVQGNAQKMQEDFEARVEELQELRQREVDELTQYFETRLTEQSNTIENLNRELREQNVESEITKRLIEEDADREILETKIKFERRLRDERETNTKLRGESGIIKKKFVSLQREIDEQKEDLKKQQLEVQKLNGVIKNLEKDIHSLKKEIMERDETIQEKEKRIYDLKKKNQELEKFKFVLDYKIKELKKQIEPREQDIKIQKDQIQEMEAELERFHKQNSQLELTITEIKQKKNTVEKELGSERQHTRDLEAILRRLKTDIYNCVGCIQEPKLLKSAIVAIYKKHIQEDTSSEATGNADMQKEFFRQREHLERSVASLRRKLSKDGEIHRTDYVRLMQENVTLISEINCLRKELRECRLNVSALEATLGLNRKSGDAARNKFAEVMKNKPNPILEMETMEANRMLQAQREMILALQDEVNTKVRTDDNDDNQQILPSIN